MMGFGPSLQVARWFGIPVRIHWTMVLWMFPLGYLAWEGLMRWEEVVWLLLAGISLMLSILLHEYGHALVARRYGVETRDIILMPIGGLARLNKLPEKPLEEVVIALAGPLVNFGVAVLLLPYLLLVMVPGLRESGPPIPGEVTGNYFFFIPLVFAMNVGLGIFNLLPAFPMDGGRVFRALLAHWLGKLRATRIAMLLGQAIALGMVALGLSGYNYLYVLLGLFVFISAWREYQRIRLEALYEQQESVEEAADDL
jgi:Zn-dependent protease